MIRVQLKFGNSDDKMPPQKRLKVTVEQQNSTSEPSTSKETETTQPKENSDWRQVNWRDRHHFAQQNHIMCDITFEVEGREIPAHKLLLAMASPVFESMFFGAMAEKGDKVVIPDLTADGFEALLKYIYANELSLSSLEQAFQLWVAADKYMVPPVKIGCSKYFEACELRADTVWSSLQTAIFLDIEELTSKCYQFLEQNTEVAMRADDFTSVSVGAMTNFLRLDSLTACEFVLMRGLIKWGKARIKDQADLTMQQALEPCVKFIRFGKMRLGEFCEILDAVPNAFKDSDSVMIMKHLARPTHYPLPDWVYCKKTRRLTPKERKWCSSPCASPSQLGFERKWDQYESNSESTTDSSSLEEDSDSSVISVESSGSGRLVGLNKRKYIRKYQSIKEWPHKVSTSNRK